MSYTTLHTIMDDGSARACAEFRNAFRGAWLVWDTLSRRYLGTGASFLGEGLRRVWDLAKRDDVPWEDRVVLASTFDRALVRRSDWQELVRCFRDYAERALDAGHIPQQADAIEAIGDGVQAIGWNQTSVSESYFATRCREGENEDGTFWEREEPFDLAKSAQHWYPLDEMREETRTVIPDEGEPGGKLARGAREGKP